MSEGPQLPPHIARAVEKRAAVIACLAVGLKHPGVATSRTAPLALEHLKELIREFKGTWGLLLAEVPLWRETLAEWARWEAAEGLPLPD